MSDKTLAEQFRDVVHNSSYMGRDASDIVHFVQNNVDKILRALELKERYDNYIQQRGWQLKRELIDRIAELEEKP